MANRQDGKKQLKDNGFGAGYPLDIADPHIGISLTPVLGCPGQNLMQGALFCCFRQEMAGMSRDLGRDVPGSGKFP